jgi:hypothetical protein
MDLALLALDLGCDPSIPNKFGVTAEKLVRDKWAAVTTHKQQDSPFGKKTEAVMKRMQALGFLR